MSEISSEEAPTEVLSVQSLLQPSAVRLGMEAESSSDIIRTLGDLLRQSGHVNEGFVEATLAREASMPTGLPLGGEYNAAIPHVDVEYVRTPALALATLRNPVVFQNMVSPEEAVPVNLVIMMALDQPKSQVEMLKQVAELLQSPDLVREIVEAEAVSQVLDIIQTA